MTAVKLSEIQHDLPGYLRRVAAGETLLIVDNDQPLAEIRPAAARPTRPRPYGLCAGEFAVPEGFDDPLPEDVLRLFEGQ
jgi:antitoxin (DNA-binding transcriptional repressor) of toxin-antitoxin stability system